MTTDIYYRYFVFSRTQMEDIKRREDKLGRVPRFGKVIVNGVSKEYTDILTDMKKAVYPDTIKITEGNIRKLVYTE